MSLIIIIDSFYKIVIFFPVKGKTPDTSQRRLSSADLFEDENDDDVFVPQVPKGIYLSIFLSLALQMLPLRRINVLFFF